jgi:hypothetical protein
VTCHEDEKNVRAELLGLDRHLLELRNGGTRFTMTETFAGFMLPMIRKTLPDLGPVFDQHAADLKREAEQVRSRNV